METLARMKLSTIFLACSLSLGVAACGGTPAPVAGPVADNGQPKMQAALDALNKAQSETQAAEANKGGHREKALERIREAIDAVNAGMAYASSHANEAGEPEGPAAPEPVDEEVKGGENQPHMASAIVALREARKQLKEAKHDKGGSRHRAIEATNAAIQQLREGIRFANHHE
jgi:hypothetical protein